MAKSKNPLVSVIVPVYNVEKYIYKCLASIFNQTYKNLEIIVVNDGSPGDIIEIVSGFQKKHKNIVLVNLNENVGLFRARIAGIQRATGKYIVHIDGDDTVGIEYVERLEAALVETVTIASNFGAFNTELKDGITGVLVEDDEQWFKKIEEMILSPDKRQQIATNAYNEAVAYRTTVSTGRVFAQWLQQRFAKNVAFVIPSSEISGGVNVVLKHADILRDHGYDVTIINYVAEKMYTAQSRRLNGYNEVLAFKTVVEQLFDEMVATLWATVSFVRGLPNVKTKTYFVQSFETSFLHPGDKNRLIANSTYCYEDIKYTTMSLWCKKWLKEDYGQNALYASNGLWGERYSYEKRDFSGRKVRILIEGDSSSEHKRVDESFRIANKLDPDSFEISYLSYNAEPKDWYRVDNKYMKIPYSEAGRIYQDHDLLIKSSELESFSYPPLEMMATGGLSVLARNGGNEEYVVDGVNAIYYQEGDIDGAIETIKDIVNDMNRFNDIANAGRRTAESRDWDVIKKEVINLYE